jgi:hypothetical protein
VAKTLKGPSSVYSLVYRRIVKQLRTDGRFKTAVADLRTWDGSASDANPMVASTGKPTVRLTPVPQSGQWYSADTQMSTLAVHVEMVIASYSVEDVLDLWDELVQALRPGNGTLANDLVALGAETGEIVFSDPSYDHNREKKDSPYWDAVGQFKVDVLRSVSP